MPVKLKTKDQLKKYITELESTETKLVVNCDIDRTLSMSHPVGPTAYIKLSVSCVILGLSGKMSVCQTYLFTEITLHMHMLLCI